MQPLNKHILFEKVDETQRASGLHMVENTNDINRPLTGKIIAISPDCDIIDYGGIKKGTIIYYVQQSALPWLKSNHFLIKSENVLGYEKVEDGI